MAAFADYTVHLLDGVIIARDEDPQEALKRVEAYR